MHSWHSFLFCTGVIAAQGKGRQAHTNPEKLEQRNTFGSMKAMYPIFQALRSILSTILSGCPAPEKRLLMVFTYVCPTAAMSSKWILLSLPPSRIASSRGNRGANAVSSPAGDICLLIICLSGKVFVPTRSGQSMFCQLLYSASHLLSEGGTTFPQILLTFGPSRPN